MLGFLLNFFQPKWKHSSPKVREKAIKKLGATKKKNAVKILLDALGDGHESVRTAATESLSQLGSQVVEPIVQSLSSQDPAVRKAAIHALGATNDSRAIKPLINVLEDEDPGVRKTVIEVLSKIGDSQVIEPIISILADNETYVRKAASDALRILAIKVGDMGIKKLSSSYNRDMKKMLDRLVRCGDSRAIMPVGKALKEGGWTIRPFAVEALSKFSSSQVVELLTIAMEDENFETRLAAVKALGNFYDSQAVELLIKSLGDTEWSVREESAKALGQLNDSRAIEPLIAAMDDEKHQVRKTVASALASIYASKSISAEQKAMILQHKDAIAQQGIKISGQPDVVKIVNSKSQEAPKPDGKDGQPAEKK